MLEPIYLLNFLLLSNWRQQDMRIPRGRGQREWKRLLSHRQQPAKSAKLSSSFPFAVQCFRNLAQLLVFSIRLTVKMKTKKEDSGWKREGGREGINHLYFIISKRIILKSFFFCFPSLLTFTINLTLILPSICLSIICLLPSLPHLD